MIHITDENEVQISGEAHIVLSQARLLVQALYEVKPFRKIFEEDMKFFNPRTSNKKVRNLIKEIYEEVSTDDKIG